MENEAAERFTLEQIAARLERPGRFVLGGPRGSSAAWYLAALRRLGARPALVVVPDAGAPASVTADARPEPAANRPPPAAKPKVKPPRPPPTPAADGIIRDYPDD